MALIYARDEDGQIVSLGKAEWLSPESEILVFHDIGHLTEQEFCELPLKEFTDFLLVRGNQRELLNFDDITTSEVCTGEAIPRPAIEFTQLTRTMVEVEPLVRRQ